MDPSQIATADLADPEKVVLGDGSEILIRRVRADDKRRIADGFDRLSPRSRYRRFFAPLARLTEADLRYLTEIDHHDHEALVALVPDADEVIGVARFIRGAEPKVAEVAVVVADDWQRRGVASALLERLVARAREEGLTHFTALVLTDNREAIELFDSLAPGGPPPRRSRSGHVELLIELPSQDGIEPESTLARALRAAAAGVTINPWHVIRHAIRRLSGERR